MSIKELYTTQKFANYTHWSAANVMTHNTKHSVLISCILLTGVIMWLVRYLKKVSFHLQEQRRVYAVTVLEAQLKTSALAVTLPHVSLVPK